jgi:acetyl esterase
MVVKENSPLLPGRLGSPNMTLKDDPRADPRMIAVLGPLGLADAQTSPVDAGTSMDEILDFVRASEMGFEDLLSSVVSGLGPVEGVTSSVEIIRGGDDNDIALFIHRPTNSGGPLPGVLHLHGGAMVMLEAAGPVYVRWRDELAASGMVVVGVEFRNGAGKHGPYPFPAGLDDCISSLQWVFDNKDALGISTLIVSGESGGGNLALATSLKAKRDGLLSLIDGVYALCPYISNAYTTKPRELMSLYENDGYFMSSEGLGVLARAYDPTGENAKNPLAWPYRANRADLEGLPPHVISVNELDPVRDEGLAYYRKLLSSGVNAIGRTVNGLCHGAECTFRAALPDAYFATIRDVNGFANSL